MESCLFCKMVRGEIPVEKVYQDDTVIVIRDINPQAPVHLLAIPRTHFAGIHLVPTNNKQLFQDIFNSISATIKQENLTESGYRLVTNFGENAGQTVFHLHVHILSGRDMKWPPG